MCRMTPSVKRATGMPARRASLAIDNLRAVVIVLVLAFHSVLAYLSFLPPHPFAFDMPPYLWRSFPIVDTARSLGFDLFCAWLDVFLMSFFFMLSGLFVWSSLERKGAWTFLSDRLLRIGVPFLVVAFLLMPVAHYPTSLQTATDPRVGACGSWRRRWAVAGPLARLWRAWFIVALASFALWLGSMSQIVADPTGSPAEWQIAAAVTVVLACFASCCFAFAATLRFAQCRTR